MDSADANAETAVDTAAPVEIVSVEFAKNGEIVLPAFSLVECFSGNLSLNIVFQIGIQLHDIEDNAMYR